MRVADTLKVASSSLTRYPLRTLMLLLAMAIGVAAVIVLTALGEGARRYVTGEFRSLGSHLLIVLPGRSETSGGGAMLIAGETPRDMTIDDALALQRSYSIEKFAPVVIGSAAVSFGGLEREVPVIGSSQELLDVRNWEMASGRFLPQVDPTRALPVAVIGAKVKRELFGDGEAIGEWVRIGDRRFRVTGILGSEGRAIGLDVQELVIIPVASAQALFNTSSLFRILATARSRDAMPRAKKDIIEIISKRHQGEEDITVITQDAVLQTFDTVFNALTMTLGGIAAISLLVAGVLIMNVMLVAVSQRTSEIGLLMAVGARRNQIIALFLTEAVLLSLVGALTGLAIGQLGSWGIRQAYPALPLAAPWWAIVAALITALASGLIFGALPARRAAAMNPVEALTGR